MTKLIIILALMLVSDYNQFPKKLRNGITIVSGQEWCPNCACGIVRQGRMRGGKNVRTINKYPWIATIDTGQSFCGGSLIKSIYVITAAHCVYQKYVRDITVSLMEHNLNSQAESNIIRRGVNRYMIHPYYDPRSLNNDIALLRLSQPVQMGVYPGMPNPVCVTRGGNSYAGANAVVIGWGRRDPRNKDLSPVLQELFLPVLSDYQCVQLFPQFMAPRKMCAGDPRYLAGTLKGDSGGPLMTNENGKYTLIGIVSSGVDPIGPTLYTRVSEFLGWIQQNTADDCWCN